MSVNKIKTLAQCHFGTSPTEMIIAEKWAVATFRVILFAMRYLGIDYGAKRVGVAYSDEAGEFAFALSVLQNDAKLIAELRKVISEKKIGMVVLGESKNFKGEENVIMKAIKEFKIVLQKETGLPVILEPEFMTSVEAERIQGKTAMHDASAAALILKSYLDKQKQS